ncbi:synapse-associated protein 1-like [Nycticebus coucang]|uniref:synapse-associated protein 1-like n=1 Tax=Nycticebus coucang TaxID=9470 RepID=UPI00234C5AF7|nr:synapse-associated protein 1-like [Nycticebus coucang]
MGQKPWHYLHVVSENSLVPLHQTTGSMLLGVAGQTSTLTEVGLEEMNSTRQEDSPLAESVRPKTPPVVIKSQLKIQEDEEEIPTSPGVSEFVSDAFDACNLNQEDLRKEMEQLVLDKKQEKTTVLEEDPADWEKELLQQELREYEVVAESEKPDENWDKEIEKMLQEENQLLPEVRE